jgi:hypothetical protein
MPDVAGVRPEFIQVMGYELALEAILLAVVPFLFLSLQIVSRAGCLSPLPLATSIADLPSGSRA